MTIDPNAPKDKPETAQMVVIHRALRREFGLLPGLVETVAPGDTARAGIVSEHANRMLAFLHEHHQSEDDLIWPILHARVPLQESLVTTMEAQHKVVADLTPTVQGQLGTWGATAGSAAQTALVADLKLLHDALVEHLDLEEKAVLPLIHEHLTVPEWLAPQEQAPKNLPPGFRNGMLIAGAVLEDSTPAEKAWFLGQMPGPVRVLWRWIGRRMYTAHVAKVRGPFTA